MILAAPNAQTPQAVLGALAGISADTAQAILGVAPIQSHTPGVSVILATNLGQIQAAIGVRRIPNPFQY